MHNRSRAAQDVLVAAGAAGAESAAEVAASADIIITMLADDQAVRAVLGDGLIPAARPGTLLIDMSTVSPALSRELAARAAGRAVRMLDAPVSGGDAGAREGTLSIMVGGDAADLERARPVLGVLGASIVHCGPSGAGQVVKACNQVLVAITIAGVSEALVLGGRHGVDREVILDVLSRGLAANRVMELRRANFLQPLVPPGLPGQPASQGPGHRAGQRRPGQRPAAADRRRAAAAAPAARRRARRRGPHRDTRRGRGAGRPGAAAARPETALPETAARPEEETG